MRLTSMQTSALVLGLSGAMGCTGSDGSPPDSGSAAAVWGQTGGASSGGSSTTGSGGLASGGVSSSGSTACTNVRPTGTEWDEGTCDEWAAQTSECDNAWMRDGNYCNESCGRCTAGGTTSTGGGTSTGGETTVDCSAAPLSGGTQQCSSNNSGSAGGGYTWTIWSSGSGGCITPYGVGAAFKATWNNSGDFLARVGLQWDETKTYDQYGTIAADYAYSKTGSGGGFSYLGIYGWSNDPLVEYYIVDDWYGSGPPTGGGTRQGSFDIDGGTYEVYTHTQVNQPSIHGTTTFPQYFSVRQTARQCGHISISEHFRQWASLGMPLGKMYEAKILVEVGGGNGSVDFTAASLTAQ